MFQCRVHPQRKKMSPMGVNSFHYVLIPVEKRGTKETGRVAFPERIPIHFIENDKAIIYIYHN